MRGVGAVASNQRMRAALYEVIRIYNKLPESAYCKVVNMAHGQTLNYRQLAGWYNDATLHTLDLTCHTHAGLYSYTRCFSSGEKQGTSLCSCPGVWICVWSVTAPYLCRSIGVDRYHVLDPLFDFELDVELSLQGGDALLVGWRTTLCPGRLRALICKRKKRLETI